MTGFGLAIAMTLAQQPAAAPPVPADVAEIHHDVIAGRNDGYDRMTVPVIIGENGTFHFVIDTGSQRTALSNELARRLAIPLLEKRRITGLVGTELADTAMLDELALGVRAFYDLPVLLFAAQHIGADGIVGTDSLQQQRVLIDFAANRMTVSDAQSQGGNAGFEIVVTARRRDGQLIVTDAMIDGVKTAIVIDTGSSTSVGNRALQRALRHRGTTGQGTLLSVTGQEVTVDIAFAKSLDIGGISISNPLIAYSDGPVFAALKLDRRPAMMLGMRELRLFRRVAIDFSKRKVLFDIPKVNKAGDS